jgi:hypothetical protein
VIREGKALSNLLPQTDEGGRRPECEPFVFCWPAAQRDPNRKPPPILTALASEVYAALLGALASSIFSPPTLTLICLGLASAFLASLIFSTPWS